MDRSRNAIVIGAGIIGCSIALELARSDWNVTVLDKGSTPGNGSTSASSAMIRFNYGSLAEAAIAWESYPRWVEWAKHLGVTDPAGMATYHKTGLLVLEGELFYTPRALAFMDQLGIPYELVDAAEIRRRFPALDPARLGPACRVEDDHFWEDPSGELGGFIQPDSGFVNDATLAAHNLAYGAEQCGATFCWRAEVNGVVRDAERVKGVTLTDGSELSADVVVNAAGPWSRQLNEMADVLGDFNTSTQAMEQEVISLPAPPGFGVDDGGLGVHDSDFATYFRPHPGGTIIVGSFEPECDPQIFLDKPEDARPSPSAENWEVQSLRLARRLPGLSIPSQKSGIVAYYDVTDDWIPIYDCTSLGGYYVAIGSSGHQFKAAPFAGVSMATLINAVEDGHNHDKEPLTVHGEWTGTDLELGYFSRLREVHPHHGMDH